jgi:hypothetical protein
MAYPCETISCPRVKYFSNPRLPYNGRPLGIDHAVNPANSADNARSMTEVKVIVANCVKDCRLSLRRGRRQTYALQFRAARNGLGRFVQTPAILRGILGIYYSFRRN